MGEGEGEFEYGSEEEAKEESPDKSECYDERGRVGIIQGEGSLPSILSAYGIRGEREREERERWVAFLLTEGHRVGIRLDILNVISRLVALPRSVGPIYTGSREGTK